MTPETSTASTSGTFCLAVPNQTAERSLQQVFHRGAANVFERSVALEQLLALRDAQMRDRRLRRLRQGVCCNGKHRCARSEFVDVYLIERVGWLVMHDRIVLIVHDVKIQGRYSGHDE